MRVSIFATLLPTPVTLLLVVSIFYTLASSYAVKSNSRKCLYICFSLKEPSNWLDSSMKSCSQASHWYSKVLKNPTFVNSFCRQVCTLHYERGGVNLDLFFGGIWHFWQRHRTCLDLHMQKMWSYFDIDQELTEFCPFWGILALTIPYVKNHNRDCESAVISLYPCWACFRTF